MLRILIILPVVLVLVLFALSNVQPVRLGFWPTDYTIQVPVALAVLGGMGVAFLIGAIILWFTVVGARFRARRAEQAARLLEAQISELKAELLPLRARAAAMPTAAAMPIGTMAIGTMPAASQSGALTVTSWRG